MSQKTLRRARRPSASVSPTVKFLTVAAAVLGAVAIAVAERRRPLRQKTQDEPRRELVNLAMGVGSALAVMAVETPLVLPVSQRAAEQRRGLVQKLPLPEWARDIVALLLMDYTIYLWHVLTHKVPLLWRFHLVHHIDLDLDATTAFRFHAVDMMISTPWRAAQVALIGVSPRGLRIWQTFFFLSILFHHANLRLPKRWERRLAWVLTTPRMHGIHHSAVVEETNSNWSSGFSFWDRLHRTFRLDVDQSDVTIGVPAYRDPNETGLMPSLEMPFRPQRADWSAPGTASRLAGEAMKRT